MRYFLVNGRKWPLAFVGLLLCFTLVLCQQDETSTETNEAQRREGNAQQSDNGKKKLIFFNCLLQPASESR